MFIWPLKEHVLFHVAGVTERNNEVTSNEVRSKGKQSKGENIQMVKIIESFKSIRIDFFSISI